MKSNFLKHAATYGLYIGLALIVLSLVDYLLGFYGQNKLFGLLQYAVMIGGILWATMQYRNTEEMGGYLSYGQSLSYGVMLSLCFGLVSSIFAVLLMTVIDPGYMEKLMDVSRAALLEEGSLTEEQVEMSITMMEKFTGNPLFVFFSGLIGSVLIGTLVSLVTSIFTKKNRPGMPFGA